MFSTHIILIASFIITVIFLLHYTPVFNYTKTKYTFSVPSKLAMLYNTSLLTQLH